MRTPLLALMTLLAATGCGPDKADDGPTTTYVGTIPGTDALVGIVAKGNGKVIGYSCGGPTSIELITTWVSGPSDGSFFELERGDGTISGTFDETGVSVTGIVDLNDVESPFTATLVEPGSSAGVYGAGLDDPDCLTGVIVLPGATPFIQGASTCGNPLNVFNQVTPGAVPTTDDGFEVTVENWASEPFLVTPVQVAPRY